MVSTFASLAKGRGFESQDGDAYLTCNYLGVLICYSKTWRWGLDRGRRKNGINEAVWNFEPCSPDYFQTFHDRVCIPEVVEIVAFFHVWEPSAKTKKTAPFLQLNTTTVGRSKAFWLLLRDHTV